MRLLSPLLLLFAFALLLFLSPSSLASPPKYRGSDGGTKFYLVGRELRVKVSLPDQRALRTNRVLLACTGAAPGLPSGEYLERARIVAGLAQTRLAAAIRPRSCRLSADKPSAENIARATVARARMSRRAS